MNELMSGLLGQFSQRAPSATVALEVTRQGAHLSGSNVAAGTKAYVQRPVYKLQFWSKPSQRSVSRGVSAMVERGRERDTGATLCALADGRRLV